MKTKRNISTSIVPLVRLGNMEKVVSVLKETGFDSFDMTMMYKLDSFDLLFTADDYIDRAKRLRHFIDEIGITCNQSHGFAPGLASSFSLEEINRRENYIKRAIEITSILGGKYCVIHPAVDCSFEENVKYIISLLPAAHKNNIKIAIENMPSKEGELFGSPEDIVKLIDMIGDEYVVACLDIGHAEMSYPKTSAVEFIDKLGDKLACLHIHDNDKIHDLHRLPFTFEINFEEVIDALKRNSYQGDVTFEVDYYFQRIPNGLFLDSIKYLHAVGKYLRDRLDN